MVPKQRFIQAFLAVFLCTFCVASQNQPSDKRLMTDTEYAKFLGRIEATLPKWEAAFDSVSPERDSQLLYAQGKSIADEKKIGLMQIGYIRQFVAKQRLKRTVSGELALSGFLQSLYDAMEQITWWEIVSETTPSNMEKYAPELSDLAIRIGNDVTARVALLEQKACP